MPRTRGGYSTRTLRMLNACRTACSNGEILFLTIFSG